MNQPLDDDGFGKGILDSVLLPFAPGEENVAADLLKGSKLVALTDDGSGTNMLKYAADPSSPDVTINGVAYDYTAVYADAIKGTTLNAILADAAEVETKAGTRTDAFRKYTQEEMNAVVRRQLEHLARLVIGLSGPIEAQVYADDKAQDVAITGLPADKDVPVITSQPADDSIADGATSTLSVTATANGGVEGYQWYAGLSGDVSSPIGGATSSSYTTPALSGPDTFDYWVRVTNTAGSVDSDTATVTVAAP